MASGSASGFRFSYNHRMAVLDIVQIGAPVLREVATPVDPGELSSPAIQSFIDDLIETMRAANGAGLAANQVARPIQICAVEVNDNPRYPYKPRIPLTILVNPVLEPVGTDTFDNYEGCLSVPNLRGLVPRYRKLRVSAIDRHGEPIDAIVDGLTAGTYQHEVDHLLGTLYVDRVTDTRTLCTWDEFTAHHKQPWLDRLRADGLVQ